MRRRMAVLLTMVLAVQCWFWTDVLVASGGVSKDRMKEAIEEFNQTPRGVRGDHLLLPVNYIEQGGRFYPYYLSGRFIRLAKDGETFTVKKEKTKSDHVYLEMVSGRGAKVRIYVHGHGDLNQAFVDAVVPHMLQDLFVFREPVHEGRYVGNLVSRILHVSGSNHIPPPDSRRYFASAAEGLDAGFTKCPVCFSEAVLLPVEGFGELRMEALENARLHELAFPPVSDPQLQHRLEEAGERVLAGFPLELQGFDYRFKVLDSELPNATSFPTGFVYVTDVLMAAIEDDTELEFVLAHEIAHVEFYKKPIFRNGGSPLEIEQTVRERYANLRAGELRSDLIALWYLVEAHGDRDIRGTAANALRKLQFATESAPPLEENAYDTHPDFGHRLNLFDDNELALSRTKPRFCAADESGDVLAWVTVLAKERGDRLSGLFLLVELSDLANKNLEMSGSSETREGAFKDEEGKDKVLFSPGWGLGAVIQPGDREVVRLRFETEFDAVDLDRIQNVEIFGLEGAKKWAICRD